MNKDIKEKIIYEEDTTNYGEFITSYFAWVPLDKQKEIVERLDKFDKIVNDLSNGLPAEIEARQRQYEYYRDKLLTFKEKN